MSPRRQLAFLWAGVALALVALAPLTTRLAAAAPACPIRAWLDLPCLTCGATRATLALARLEPAAAFAFNPLVAGAWLGLVAGGLIAGGLAIVGRPLPAWSLRPTLGLRMTVGALLLANWAYLIRAGI